MPDQSANATAIRSPANYRQTAYVSVLTGTVVMAATLTTTPSDPATELDISISSGSISDVKQGFLVRFFTSGGELKGETQVRFSGTNDSNTLFIQETSLADIDITSSDNLKVYGLPVALDKLVDATKRFNPDGLTYTDETTDPAPVANSGGHWAGHVDTGATYATVQRTGSTSFTVDPDSGGSVTHSWTLPTGVAFASGSSATDADPTLEVNVGEYLIEHTVTDSSNSKSRTQRILMRCHDKVTDPAFDGIIQQLGADESSGWQTTVEIFGEQDLDAIPDGSLVIVWSDEYINDTLQSFGAAANDSSHIRCIGYIRRETVTQDADVGTITFEVISPIQRLSEIRGFSKIFQHKASPNRWHKVKTLGVQRAVSLLWLYYLSFGEAGFDLVVDGSFTDYNFSEFGIQKMAPIDQIRDLAKATDGRFVCDRTGRFMLQGRPELLALGSPRDNLTTIFTLTSDDVISIELTREHWYPVETYYARGFTDGTATADNDPIFARWPGNAPGVGNSSQTADRLIGDDLDDLLARVGFHAALENEVYYDTNNVKRRAPRVRATLFGAYDFFDLYAEWVAFDSTVTNPRSIDLTAFRWVVRRVNIEFSDDGDATTHLELQAETHAPPGIEDPQNDVSFGNITLPSLMFDPIATVPSSGDIATLNQVVNTVAAFSSDGYVYFWSNFKGTPVVTRTDLTSLSPALGGTLLGFAVDPFSPLYISTGTTVDGKIVTTTGIYGITDIFSVSGGITLALEDTFAITAGNAYVMTERAEQDWWLVHLYSNNASAGSIVYYTTDGGSTWNNTGQDLGGVATGRTAVAAASQQPSIQIIADGNGIAYVMAFEGTSDAAIYKTTDHGATWAKETLPSNVGAQLGFFHIPYGDSSTFHYNKRTGPTTANEQYVMHSSTETNVEPTNGYGIRSFRSVHASDNFPLYVAALLSAEPADSTLLYTAIDGVQSASSWTYTGHVWTSPDRIFSLSVGSDNPNILYLWGEGLMKLSLDRGVTLIDKEGNLSDFSPGTLLNICGG